FLKLGAAIACSPSADSDERVFDEFVTRNRKVLGRRTLPDTAGRVVVRTVAGAQPAAEIAARIVRLLTERNTAEMRADANDDQPFGVGRAFRIRLRIGQILDIDLRRLVDFFRRAVAD